MEDVLPTLITLFEPKSDHKGSNPKMKDIQGCRLRGWNEDRRSPQPGLLIDPKNDSSVSKVVQQTTWLDRSSTMEKGYTPATLEGGLMPKFVNRHPPIGNE
jgi:hypothetical protein